MKTAYWNDDYFDFDMGNESETYIDNEYDYDYGADNNISLQYYGHGLEIGDCGMKFVNNYKAGPRVISCRVRANESDPWIYEEATIHGYNSNYTCPPELEFKPVDVRVVLPGENVETLYRIKSNSSLTYWGFKVSRNDNFIDLSLGHNSSPPPGYAYFGDSLEKGHCGVEISKVAEEDNGFLSCKIQLDNNHDTYSVLYSTLIVAEKPTKTFLTLFNDTYSEGDTLTATCESLMSLLVARITWFLDDKVIRQDDIDDSSSSDRWKYRNNVQGITQTIVINNLTWPAKEDLACEFSHVALPGGVEILTERIDARRETPITSVTMRCAWTLHII